MRRLVGVEGDWVAPGPGRGPAEAVPRGHVWLEADGDAGAAPAAHAGAVPAALLTGRVTAVLWPPGRAGRLQPRPPAAGRVVQFAFHKGGGS